MTTSIDSQTEYLSAEITNDEGISKTIVCHNVNLEPHTLPYILETKIISEDNHVLIRTALIRALVYCSSIDEFESERLYIATSLMINGASKDCIETAEKHFRDEFKFCVVDACTIDKDIYQNVRRLLRRTTTRVNKYML